MYMDSLAGQNVAVVYDNDFEGNGNFESYEDLYSNGPMSVQFVSEVGARRLQRKIPASQQFEAKASPSSFDGEDGNGIKRRRRNSLKLQCPTCSKEYLNQASYEKHLRLHRRKKRMPTGTGTGEPRRRVGRPRKQTSAVETKPNYREIDEDEPFFSEGSGLDPSITVSGDNDYLPTWARRKVSCTECGKKFMSHGHLVRARTFEIMVNQRKSHWKYWEKPYCSIWLKICHNLTHEKVMVISIIILYDNTIIPELRQNFAKSDSRATCLSPYIQ